MNRLPELYRAAYEAAVANGDKTYQGRPCRKGGHDGTRYVKSGGCVACTQKQALGRYHAGDKKQNTDGQRRWQHSNVARQRWLAAKARAEKEGTPFSIVAEDVVVPSHCPILGLPLDSRDRDHTPNLDKIDNLKGYVPKNVAVISGRANRIKSDASIEELQAIVAYMQRNLATPSL